MKYSKEFLAALAHTKDIEGVYSADRYDPGGETFCGISRVYWPNWIGWAIIDGWDKTGTPPDLIEEIREFYYINFWCRVQGDLVSKYSFSIAQELFDTAVNLDVPDAVRFLQVALNRQNNYGKIYPDLLDDGKFGKKTIETFERYCQYKPFNINEEILLNCLNGEQYIYYTENPQHERYRGWFRRV